MFKKRYLVNGELIVEGQLKKWFNMVVVARPKDVWNVVRTDIAEYFKADKEDVRILGVFKL